MEPRQRACTCLLEVRRYKQTLCTRCHLSTCAPHVRRRQRPTFEILTGLLGWPVESVTTRFLTTMGSPSATVLAVDRPIDASALCLRAGARTLHSDRAVTPIHSDTALC